MKDPVSVVTHFNNRFTSFLYKIILNENGPFGKVIQYYYRLEYQVRGAPHIHMKIWVKDAQVFGKNSEEVIIEFVQNHITCELPDEQKNPILFDLVNRYQMHRCSNSCKRFITRNSKCFTTCR